MARRPLCLIVNPSAGRGRAARLLPQVEQALRARGMSFRVERTHSLAHSRELARDALAAGEVAAALGGDGLLGAVAGELRGTDGVLGVLPGGRGNDFARKLGIGPDPERACDVLDVVLMRTATKSSYLACLPKVFKGTHVDNPNLTFLQGREIAFHADRPFAA